MNTRTIAVLGYISAYVLVGIMYWLVCKSIIWKIIVSIVSAMMALFMLK